MSENKVAGIPCYDPFTSIQIDHSGKVWLCLCTSWTKLPSIGNIFERPLSEIWNSKVASNIRNLFYTDKYLKFCNRAFCPKLQDVATRDRDLQFLDAAHQHDILGKKTILNAPFTRVSLNTDFRCNLRCIMCETNKTDTSQNSKVTKKAIQALYPHFHHIKQLAPCVSGETFAVPEIMDLLKGQALAENHVNLHIVTNGTLFNEKNWCKISHNKFKSLVLSIDGIEDVYERIRINAKWNILLENLSLISRLRKSGKIPHVSIATVVMKENINQLKDLVRLTKECNFDCIKFQPIIGDLSEQNIFYHRNLKYLEMLNRTLNDHLLDDEIVDLWSIRAFKEDNWKKIVLNSQKPAPFGQRKILNYIKKIFQ